jgi:hypothetical protein
VCPHYFEPEEMHIHDLGDLDDADYMDLKTGRSRKECVDPDCPDKQPPVANPDPDLAYAPDGSVVGRVVGWAGDVPVIEP